MSIFQAREWWSAETEVASVNEAPDDEEDGDVDVVTSGGGDTGDDDDIDILKSVSVETASFASTMGNQVNHTELAKKVCPRLHELAPEPEAGSRNLGQTFLAISVCTARVKPKTCTCTKSMLSSLTLTPVHHRAYRTKKMFFFRPM